MAQDLPITADGLTRKQFIKKWGFDPMAPTPKGGDRYDSRMKKLVKNWKQQQLAMGNKKRK